MGIVNACSTTYLSKYIRLDTLIGSIALLLLNIWVWFIDETEMEINRSGNFVETKKMILMK